MRSKTRTLLFISLSLALLAAPRPALSQTEGDYLYNVTMLRAAPGHFSDLIETLSAAEALHVQAGDEPPFWIRHSQGDQWDFMLIYPLDSFEEHFSSSRVEQRREAWGAPRARQLATRLEQFTAFEEEWFARSVDLPEMQRRFEGMGMLHVEMFAGLPGQRDALLEQRRMENRYYEELGRQLNVLFVREAGPNWDAMTIGFYASLQDYAAAGVRFSEEEQDEAARAAGFDGVGDISPYLRSLLSYHHDTIAVPAR